MPNLTEMPVLKLKGTPKQRAAKKLLAACKRDAKENTLNSYACAHVALDELLAALKEEPPFKPELLK